MSAHNITIYMPRPLADAGEPTKWSGEVEIYGDHDADDDARLEYLFRHFNRVVSKDILRLEDMNYDLPSLHSGMLVEIEDRMYECLSIGWARVTDISEEEAPQIFACRPEDVVEG